MYECFEFDVFITINFIALLIGIVTLLIKFIIGVYLHIHNWF